MRALVIVVALAAVAVPSQAQDKQVIRPPGGRSSAPYSPAVRVGNLLFLSGQIGRVPGGGLADTTVAGQTRQALENVRALLELAGSSLDRVAKCTVFLADIRDYGVMNQAYSAVFTTDPPARSAVAVSGLPAGAKVEIECIAIAGG